MRKIIIIVVCCVAILFGGYAGYQWYKVRKQNHLIGLAQQFLAQSEGQKALLCLQLVLRSNPNNLEAVRMMANLTDAAHSPSAISWRKRVAELNPDSLEDKLSLVQTAIVLHDYNTATNALATVSVAGKKTAAFQNVAGTVAEVANQMAEAEAYFVEAARLQPANQSIQLNLATMRLHGTNVSAKAQARGVLTRISADSSQPALRRVALRELIFDAEHSLQLQTALALSKELVQQTNASFNDKMLRLNLLKQAGSAEFEPMLKELEGTAVNYPTGVNALATWQMLNVSLDSTLKWLRTLPTDIQTNQPATMLMAQCLTLKQDWPGLRTWIDKQNWGNLDFLRHAFLARALRELGLTATSETEWQQAVKIVNDREFNQEANLTMLLRLTAQWNWQSKGEDILWAIVNKYPGEQWAYHALVQILFTSGRTRPLMMLYSQQLKWDSSDYSAQNNMATCALLLDAQEMKPQEVARGLFEKDPRKPSYVSTYAFSLYLQKKYAEALKVIEQLKPEELKKPSVAGYYGIILKANGHPTQAKTYLDLATKSTLLPEEQKLFSQARAGL